MKPIALLLEDNPKSLTARATLFKTLGMLVVTAKGLDEARRKYAYTPSVDLVVCDYNLDGSDPDNDDGVVFARELRKQGSAVPMVLYSGRDEVDIEPLLHVQGADESTMVPAIDTPFNFGASRAKMPKEAQSVWYKAALDHVEQKIGSGVTVMTKIGEKYDLTSLELSSLMNLVPARGTLIGSRDSDVDELRFVKSERESEFRRSGFRVKVLEPGVFSAHGRSEIELIKPLSVWIHSNDGKVIVEAIGCPDFRSSHEDETLSISGLVAFMHNEFRENKSSRVGAFAKKYFN